MLNEKKVVPKLWQEVKVKVYTVTSDDIKIYYTGKFQDFTARYIIKIKKLLSIYSESVPRSGSSHSDMPKKKNPGFCIHLID